MAYLIRLIALVMSFLHGAIDVGAQPYPTRPVRLIVPYAAGNAADISARSLAGELTKQMG